MEGHLPTMQDESSGFPNALSSHASHHKISWSLVIQTVKKFFLPSLLQGKVIGDAKLLMSCGCRKGKNTQVKDSDQVSQSVLKLVEK